MSPDGSRVAYVRELNGENVMLVVDVETKKLIGGTRYETLKPRAITFVNNDLVLFGGSETTKFRGIAQKSSSARQMAYSISEDKSVTMLGDNDRLYPGSSGNGIFKVDEERNLVFMNGARRPVRWCEEPN